MSLLFLESTQDILFILVVALIIFGPRKLPQLSRTIGKSLAEFKRASEEFKRTWEQEVAMESSQKEARIEQAMLPPERSAAGTSIERGSTIEASPYEDSNRIAPASQASLQDVTAQQVAPLEVQHTTADAEEASDIATSAGANGGAPKASIPGRKRDWL